MCIINALKKLISQNTKNTFKYIIQPGVLEWIFNDSKWVSELTQSKEKEWGQKVIGNLSNQWTTKLSEYSFKELMLLFDKKVVKCKGKLSSNGKKIVPDFESEECLYEIKARTYTTSGTAGEKILGTPLKYSECYRLFNKKLYIVCMSYQMEEAINDFNLFNPKSDELTTILDFYDNNLNIKYITIKELFENFLNEPIKTTPVIKWAGGKRSIMSQLVNYIPISFYNYHEPFFGGGSVFLELYNKNLLQDKKIYLSDALSPLMITYEVIKNNLLTLLKELKESYNTVSKEIYEQNKIDFNKWKFEIHKENYVKIACLFLYLNKTCFNGLYRENKSGLFNVPFGKPKHINYNEENLTNLSNILNSANICLNTCDYNLTLDNIQTGDFVYLDPPYHNTFTQYTKDSFTEFDQQSVYNYFQKLDKLGCKVMLSNSNTYFIKNLYQNYNIYELDVKRLINSDLSQRNSKKTELVITNYQM